MRKVLLLIVVVVIAGAAYLYLNRNSLLEGVIERAGTNATGVAVEVGAVDLNLQDQRATISAFTVANPPGFSGGHVFTLNEISVTVESVSRDLIVLNEVVVDDPRVLYEFAESGSNIDVLRNNIRSNQGSAGSSGGGSDTKIIINTLRFTGGNVHAVGGGEELDVNLPPLTLRDLGRASGGETAGQIAVQIADRLTQHVAQTVAQSEIERRLGVDGVLDRVRGVFGN